MLPAAELGDTSTNPWPADTVSRLPIDQMQPYERNARIHSDMQVDQIAASIKAFGFAVPILIDVSNTVIAGHGRLEAAKQLGLDEVPVMVAKGWSAKQIKAYRLADNQLALNAAWDVKLLAAELGELTDMQDLIGFSDDELHAILNGRQGLTDPDEAPPLPAEPTTRKGDLWICGKHRVLCGDSTSAADVSTLLGGTKIDMVLTDPPYCSGGFQEAGKGAGSVGTRGTEMVANDTLSTRGYMALMRAVIPQFAAGVVYVFTDWRMWINLFDVVESSGYGVRNMVVWDKGTPGMGAGWRMQHELIMCGIRVKSPFNPKKAQGNVIQSKRTGNILHAVEKPVDLLQTIIEVTDQAKTIADPFCGSGPTLIAGELTGRSVYGMELMPGYCDVAVQRWQDFTGEKAQLDGTGEDFATVAAART